MRPPQAEVARVIVERATDALALMPFEKMHPETLLKIIDRLTAIYGTEKEETRVCKKHPSWMICPRRMLFYGLFLCHFRLQALGDGLFGDFAGAVKSDLCQHGADQLIYEHGKQRDVADNDTCLNGFGCAD